jgi:triacylglycerol esterase/lipase EstA (alpha/beta hydrolase family)
VAAGISPLADKNGPNHSTPEEASTGKPKSCLIFDPDVYFHRITYAAGRFVAVGLRLDGSVGYGTHGAIVTSTDAVNWTEIDFTGSIYSLDAITYGNGRFVAVGFAGGYAATILTSEDGLNWTQQIAGTTDDCQAVCYGNGQFVISGNPGLILTSPDGITWTNRGSITQGQLPGIAYGNGTYVSVGYAPGFYYVGAAFSSADGITWNSHLFGPQQFLNAITYAENKFVAVANGALIFTSPDGSTWSSAGTGASNTLFDITYGNGLFVGVGANGEVDVSPDAEKWQTGNAGTANALFGVAYDGSKFIAVGDAGTIVEVPGLIASIHSVSVSGSSTPIDHSLPDDVDAPIVLLPDETHLTGQPTVTSGLVADGVTPLLIQFDPNPLPTVPTPYTITMDVTGGTVSGDLPSHLYALQQTGSTSEFVLGNSVTVSIAHPTGFAYINGIPSQDVTFDPGIKELNVTLKITKDGDTTPTATIAFRIRKPPIVLVHGYHSSNDTWYQPDKTTPAGFLAALQNVFPSDFIMPIEYGVQRTGTDVDVTRNTSDSFDTLASVLNAQLEAEVESQDSAWHQAWAFIRYDIVAHSQGGLLARMLCTDKQPSFAFAFRSPVNAFRGRFDRVMTLNSPHNGSTILHYLLDLQEEGYLVTAALKSFIQDKFDPFGPASQIQEINSEYPADSTVKIHLVGTEIDTGTSDTNIFGVPLCYSATGLSGRVSGQNYSRGDVVIPLGSDGVVDFASQFAGAGAGDLQGTNISHSGPYYVFGVTPHDTVTVSATIGSHVADLLNGPSENFGSFNLQPIDQGIEAQIDAIVPAVPVNGSLIQIFHPAAPGRDAPKAGSKVYQFTISPADDQAPAGPPYWYAEAVGPNGSTTDGITLTADPQTPAIVSVSVSRSVLGAVVLHASYNDVNGNLVTGDPVVVVSKPPGQTLTGIELVPNAVSLTAASNVLTEVWGDYDNGTRSQLFIPSDAEITYTSEDPTIATVDKRGNIQMVAVGSTNIDITYLGFTAQTLVTVTAPPPPPVLAPLGAVSRKVHKAAGAFDLNLPLTGEGAIECRSGGRAGKYQVVVTFSSPVTVANAVLSSGVGTVTNFQVAGRQVTINLQGVTNAQRIALTLSGVSDGTITNDVVIPMAVLVGDLTADGIVDTTDQTQARSAIGQPVTIVNFRDDLMPDGKLNKKDAQTVKANLGMRLPP